MSMPNLLPFFGNDARRTGSYCDVGSHWSDKTPEGAEVAPPAEVYFLGEDDRRNDVWGCATCLRKFQATDPSKFQAIHARADSDPARCVPVI